MNIIVDINEDMTKIEDSVESAESRASEKSKNFVKDFYHLTFSR